MNTITTETTTATLCPQCNARPLPAPTGPTYNRYIPKLCEECWSANHAAKMAAEAEQREATKREHAIQCQEIAEALTAATGNGYSVTQWDKESQWQVAATLQSDTHALDITRRLDTPNRLIIRGTYDHTTRDYRDHDEPATKITASATKTAKQIARDIERRILAQVIENTRKRNERMQASAAAFNTAAKIGAQLIAASNGTLTSDESSANKGESTTYTARITNKSSAYGKFEARADSVTIEINHTTHEKALKIAAILGE